MTNRRLLLWPPPDEANPYLARLEGALRRRGVDVRTGVRLAALCAAPRGAQWLHVHWPEWMMQHRSRVAYRARTMWVRALLDAARARGVSIAWTAHNRIGHDDPHPDLGVAARHMLLARCDAVFGHFAAAEPWARSLGFRGRFAVHPHPGFAADYADPFADAAARRAFRAAHGIADDELLLVSPGSIEPYKRLPRVAEALRSIDGVRWRWTAVGRAAPEPLRALRSAAADDARIRVEVGFADRARLAAWIAAADATVLAHDDLFTSGSAVLSLSLGTPVLGPSVQHLATFAGAPFFVAWDPESPSTLGPALDVLRTMAGDARDAARRTAAATTWDDAAAVVDAHLVGAAA